MRLVFVHADSFAFEANAPVSETAAERADEQDGADAPREGRMDDCVVAFVAVERTDTADLDAAVANAAAHARDVVDHLGVRRLVLYPAAHLTDHAADREAARTALRDLHVDLADDVEVLRAPVDWYTAVEASLKGHPHAVTSRRVGPVRDADAEDAEPSPSDLAVAFPDGEVLPASEAATSDRIADGLRTLLDAETGGGLATGLRRSRWLESLADAGLADAPESDVAGGLRWHPRGTLVRDLLTERVTDLAVAEGAMPVETLGGDPPTAGDRQTLAVSDRPTPTATANAVAAVFGEFSLAESDSSLSASDLAVPESDLPLRLYRRGGTGTARSRPAAAQDSAATPEVHAVAGDRDEARAELRRWVGVCRRIWDDLGVETTLVARIASEFDDEQAWVTPLVADLGAPALVERLPDAPGRWSVEVALAVADDSGPPVEVAAVRLDAGSTGETLVQCSPVGGVERALAVLLERGDADGGEAAAPLPTWLAPSQVRFVPVDEAHVECCDAFAADLESAGVRADVDDRDAPVGERVARAERDRVPYLAVVGAREVTAARDGDRDDVALPVTVRAEQTERAVTLADLRDAVLADVGDYPARDRYLPRRVGERPTFGGR